RKGIVRTQDKLAFDRMAEVRVLLKFKLILLGNFTRPYIGCFHQVERMFFSYILSPGVRVVQGHGVQVVSVCPVQHFKARSDGGAGNVAPAGTQIEGSNNLGEGKARLSTVTVET